MDPRIQLVDMLFRFAVVGQLTLLAVVLLRHRPLTARSGLLLALCPCAAGYVLLTAPVGELLQDYRGVLLVLTHLLPYLVWTLGIGIFDERFELSRLPAWARAAIGLFALWHVYFFGVLEGQGPFHALSHLLYVGLFGHLVVVAVMGLRDDLIEPRRKARLLLLAFASVQLLIIVLVELASPRLGDAQTFSVLNAAALFVLVSTVGAHLLGGSRADILADPPREPARLEHAPEIPPQDRELHDALAHFMASGGYRRTGLTIGLLASELAVPEHRLRRLINGRLGFRNFSAFLNAYRIREACEKLTDEHLARTPVLTIALELGYGSIGPFNRAFKAIVGQTPTEFRRNGRT